jgi:hypothetical protein
MVELFFLIGLSITLPPSYATYFVIYQVTMAGDSWHSSKIIHVDEKNHLNDYFWAI